MKIKSYVTKQRLENSFFRKEKRLFLGCMDIELTARCNNNCIHCYINLPADDFKAKRKELPTCEIKEILKEAVSLGCLRVRFTGGEPLLREDFKKLYIFARKLGLRVIISSNATLITSRLAKLFASVPPLEKIEITVYGMKKSSYEAVTRMKGSFEYAWQGINLLLEYRIPFVVRGTLLPYNKHEIDEFEEWAATIPWMDKTPSYSMFFDLRCRRDNEQKNQLIKSIRLSPQEGLEVFVHKKDKYIKQMKQFCAKFMGTSGDKLFSCGAGANSGSIDAYGIFQPCLLLRHPNCTYDLKKGSLRNAITSFFPKIREMKATNPDYLNRCANCFLHGLCEQCPGKSWIEHGSLDTPVEYLCEVAHAQARYIGLLKNSEKAWKVKDGNQRVKMFTQEI